MTHLKSLSLVPSLLACCAWSAWASEQPVISLVCSQTELTESENPYTANLTVSRSIVGNGPLTVQLANSGSAANANDVSGLLNAVTIPAGKASVTFQIAVVDDEIFDGKKHLTVAIKDAANYHVSGSSKVHLSVLDFSLSANFPGLDLDVGGVNRAELRLQLPPWIYDQPTTKSPLVIHFNGGYGGTITGPNTLIPYTTYGQWSIADRHSIGALPTPGATKANGWAYLSMDTFRAGSDVVIGENAGDGLKNAKNWNAMLDWLQKTYPTLPIDWTHVACTGYSNGGHALMAVLNDRVSNPAAKTQTETFLKRINGMVLFDGAACALYPGGYDAIAEHFAGLGLRLAVINSDQGSFSASSVDDFADAMGVEINAADKALQYYEIGGDHADNPQTPKVESNWTTYAEKLATRQFLDAILTKPKLTPAAPNQPPTVAIAAPVSGVRGSVIPLQVTLNDKDGEVASATLFVMRPGENGWRSLDSLETTVSQTVLWVPSADLPLGTYKLWLTADDDDGERVSAYDNITLVDGGGAPDAKPTCTLVSPANGVSFTVGSSVTISASGNDDQQLASLSVSIDGELLGNKTAPVEQQLQTWTWDTSDMTAGVHTLVLTATDSAGQSTSVTRQVTLVDQEIPTGDTVTFTLPANMKVGKDYPVTFTSLPLRYQSRTLRAVQLFKYNTPTDYDGTGKNQLLFRAYLKNTFVVRVRAIYGNGTNQVVLWSEAKNYTVSK